MDMNQFIILQDERIINLADVCRITPVPRSINYTITFISNTSPETINVVERAAIVAHIRKWKEIQELQAKLAEGYERDADGGVHLRIPAPT